MMDSKNEVIEIDFNLPPNQIMYAILSLPLQEQEYWCALWITKPEILNEMRHRPIPKRPTKLHTEIEAKAIYEERERIKSRNWSNFHNLRWAKSVLEDQSLKDRIDQVINGFIDIEEHPDPINVPKPEQQWTD